MNGWLEQQKNRTNKRGVKLRGLQTGVERLNSTWSRGYGSIIVFAFKHL